MSDQRRQASAVALKVLGAALLLFIPSTALAGPADPLGELRIDQWATHIAEASSRFGIPQDWIRRVMHAESGGRTVLKGRPITSSAGAMGLMQVMPATWAEMRARHGLGPDPHQPRDNILAGAAYLRAMYQRFGYPGLFAAYNAGPARYARHLASGRRLPAETLAYVAAVGEGSSLAAARVRVAARQSGIFVLLPHIRGGNVEARSVPAAPGALFVKLSRPFPTD